MTKDGVRWGEGKKYKINKITSRLSIAKKDTLVPTFSNKLKDLKKKIEFTACSSLFRRRNANKNRIACQDAGDSCKW